MDIILGAAAILLNEAAEKTGLTWLVFPAGILFIVGGIFWWKKAR
ncbi:MAG: hypothetical protein PHF35_03690 [Candidatus Moranbacteria bacterium]|nr:hypothetical protein [Candidatus Moranbacteria bacterium]